MSARVRSLLVLVPTLVALLLGGVSQARGQSSPAGAPTTTVDLLGDIIGKLLPTTTVVTTVPPPAPPPATAPPAAGPSGKPTTTTTARPGARVVPPEFARIINSVPRTGGRNTVALLSALKRLHDLGVSTDEIILKGMGRFPVGGEGAYSDDWLAARFTPTFHLHKGTDIFAARGTPVRAPADGVVRFADEGAGGKAAYVTVPDGTFYYMAHLDSFAPQLKAGARVKQGQMVGTVGSTGNAEGGSPHLHFEIHPRGGAAVNPKPILDGWLDVALAQVPALLASYQVGVSRALTATAALRELGDLPAAGSSGAGSVDAPLMWASTLAAGGGGLRLAEVELARTLDRIDWGQMVRSDLANAEIEREAQALAISVLGPVTPPGVGLLLGAGSGEGG